MDATAKLRSAAKLHVATWVWTRGTGSTQTTAHGTGHADVERNSGTKAAAAPR